MADLCVWENGRDHPDNPASCYHGDQRLGRWEVRLPGAVAIGNFDNGYQDGLWEWRMVVDGEEKLLRPYYLQTEEAWNYGFIMDKYISQSIPLGENEYGHQAFDNTYTEIGKLLHEFKYRNNQAAMPKLLAFAVTFLAHHKKAKFDMVVPIPSSSGKTVTAQLAEGIAKRMNKRYCADALTTSNKKVVKNVAVEERYAVLRDAISASPEKLENTKVLLVDDLFDSGTTLDIANCVALQNGAIEAHVFAFAYTKHVLASSPQTQSEPDPDPEFDDDIAPF